MFFQQKLYYFQFSACKTEYYGKCRFVSLTVRILYIPEHRIPYFLWRRIFLSACPHPLYTRSRHPLYTRPYRTIQKIPYRIPDEYHTKKYRTTYQKNIVSHSRRYRNPAMQCSSKNTVPHTIPYHAIPYRTIPYPYPAIPYCTHPCLLYTSDAADE